MRVISGSARGTKLETLEGLATRPTTDRIKESIFNLIQFYIQDSTVLDMFSGSGALGLEAGSRGAKEVFLIENNKKCHDIIESNIKRCGLEEKVKLFKIDAFSGVSRLNQNLDVIILDPPYGEKLVSKALESISSSKLLNEDGIIVVEHSITDILEEKIHGFKMTRQKKYGKILVSIFSYDN